jgi:hypothetical protein
MSNWWQILDYEQVPTSYLDKCNSATRDDLWTSLQLLREYGNRCPSTISEALGHDSRLFSLKAKSRSRKVHIRMIYFFFSAARKQIIFVDVIEKKKRALEPADLKTALKRKADVETGTINAETFGRKPTPEQTS